MGSMFATEYTSEVGRGLPFSCSRGVLCIFLDLIPAGIPDDIFRKQWQTVRTMHAFT